MSEANLVWLIMVVVFYTILIWAWGFAVGYNQK